MTLSDDEATHIKSELDWFAHHLVAPALDDRKRRAVFWFRARSPLVQRTWDIAWPLREWGVQLRLLQSRQPGCIVYEDEHQVAAVPHRKFHSQR